MPGILPMKLIKCGSSQTRIAQACDRCRSKKIRCDGVRPCCSQCANVGFECKTSDKLSRRAFPRGYTESLEERVRGLESEVRQLKELLDAKDEQLDMLSRIHSFSPYSPPPSASSGAPVRMRRTPSSRGSSEEAAPVEEMVLLPEAPALVGGCYEADGIFVGASSGRSFAALLKQKLRSSGRYTVDVDTDGLFLGHSQDEPASLRSVDFNAVPRLLADQLVTLYFQEYHPLYPVLHRPTLLAAYDDFVSDEHDKLRSLSKHTIAQLFLVFAIALQQIDPNNTSHQRSIDEQWQLALESVLSETSVRTLQCLLLAQLYYFACGNHSRLLHYKSLTVGTALRLGLNQSQRKFGLGALAGEMRKRAFWCVYTLDAFSASMSGIPRLLRDDDVDTEYPSDIDDEFVSEEGFLPTLPGDSTKISSALALFRCSRVLAKVVDTVYATTGSRSISYSRLKELEEDLDSWKRGLAPHLRLEFVNGAPGTNMVHSRSPLLILSYHYTRSLLHRPIVSNNSTHAHLTSASSLALRDSSKSIIQILQLLSERKLGFSFCLNRAQLLLESGIAILISSEESNREGTLAKENHKLANTVFADLKRGNNQEVTRAFSVLASMVLRQGPADISPRSSSESVRPTTAASVPSQHNTQQQQQPMSSMRKRMSSASIKLHRLSTSASAHGIDSIPRRHQSVTVSRHNQQHSAFPKPSPTPTGRHSISFPTPEYVWPSSAGAATDTSPETSNADDWERMLAMMDASHAAHIYGDFVEEVKIERPVPSSSVANAGMHATERISMSNRVSIDGGSMGGGRLSLDGYAPQQGTPSLRSFDGSSEGSLRSDEGAAGWEVVEPIGYVGFPGVELPAGVEDGWM